MSNYTKATDFAAKDGLTTGNPSKAIVGTEIDDEFEAIETAISTKADTAAPSFTGSASAVDLDITGTQTVDTIDESTAAAGVTIEGVLLKDSGITATGVVDLSGASDLLLTSESVVDHEADLTNVLHNTADVDVDAGTTRTLDADDLGYDIFCTTGTGMTITVPTDLGVGFQCSITQTGAGTVTITAADTLNGAGDDIDLPSQYSTVWLVQFQEGAWLVSGV